MMKLRSKQSGFTIIELMLAMSFFTFVVLAGVVAFVQINKAFVAGLTSKEIQNSARTVVDDISRSIREASASDVIIQNYITQSGPTSNLRMCIGSTRYAWNMAISDTQLTNERYSDGARRRFEFSRASGGACEAPVPEHSGTLAMLQDDISVQYFDVERLGTSSSFRVVLVVSTDAQEFPDDFTEFGENASCVVQNGSQFCDVVRLETVVTARN